MNAGPVTEADARRALRAAGVAADGPLHKVPSHSNDVWAGDDHVVLVGRPDGPRLLAHQAGILEALPPEMPHAPLVDFQETAELEWLVLRRVAGVTMHVAWPGLDQRQRRSLVSQLVRRRRARRATPHSAPRLRVRPPGGA